MISITDKFAVEKQELERQSMLASSMRIDVLLKINLGSKTKNQNEMIKWYAMLEEIESLIYRTRRKIESIDSTDYLTHLPINNIKN
jgi:hypothetical protein